MTEQRDVGEDSVHALSVTVLPKFYPMHFHRQRARLHGAGDVGHFDLRENGEALLLQQ